MILAVHVSDAVLRPEWWVGGWIVAVLLTALGTYRLNAETMPRLAMMTAIFFMASSVHIPAGPGRVHLLLTGLVGAIASYRSGLVVIAGLLLQNRLVGHGGLLSLGFNTVAMAVPAILIGVSLQRFLKRFNATPGNLACFGFFAGAIGVAFTVGISYVGLYFGSAPEWRSVTWVFVVAHIPILFAEAILTAVILRHLTRVGYSFSSPNGTTSSNGTSH